MSGIEPGLLIALIGAGATAASVGTSLALRPGLPKITLPTPPPVVPPPAEPPPAAPTETEIGEGVATRRRRRQRGFGLSQTTIVPPTVRLGDSAIGPAQGFPALGG